MLAFLAEYFATPSVSAHFQTNRLKFLNETQPPNWTHLFYVIAWSRLEAEDTPLWLGRSLGGMVSIQENVFFFCQFCCIISVVAAKGLDTDFFLLPFRWSSLKWHAVKWVVVCGGSSLLVVNRCRYLIVVSATSSQHFGDCFFMFAVGVV